MPATISAVTYTARQIRVAPLLSTGAYGTVSVALAYQGQVEINVQADQDKLQSNGLMIETLAVPTHIEGMFTQGAIDPEAMLVMTATTVTSSGTTPNRSGQENWLAGDSGLPYFGMVIDYATTGGGNQLVGLYRCKLDSFPSLKNDQNKFRISELKFTAIANNDSARRLLRSIRYETATAIPVDVNSFLI